MSFEARGLSSSLLGAAAFCAAAMLAPAAYADTKALVTFDDLPQGPCCYVSAVPSPQTIVTTPATFTGGVILGDASAFPAIVFATAPNVYGTADFGIGLSPSLTITVNPTFAANEVSFALFNGYPSTLSYEADAYNGAQLVASQVLSIAPNSSSGYGLVDLKNAGGITSVSVYQQNSNGTWDFLIDTVAFNEPITSAVPEPTTWATMALGLGLLGLRRTRRRG